MTRDHKPRRLEPPGPDAWLGRDSLGRDYLARVLVGGRTSLLVGLVATAASVTIGVLVERWLFFAEAKHTVSLYYGADEA